MRKRLRSEAGFSLPELLISIIIGVVIIGTLVAVVTIADRGSARVTGRVDANQTTRPVVQRIMDLLHSSCVARGVAPVLAGSTATQLEFVNGTGSAASVTPVKKQLFLSGTTLYERTYAVSGGVAPNWTFSSTPTGSTRVLATGVSQTRRIGTSGAVTPMFQYFKYVNGEVSPTRLTVPLSAADAATTVQVTISFEVAPMNNGARDVNAATAVTDSAVLRFAPAAETTTEANLPCT